jgi:hypothetical protein
LVLLPGIHFVARDLASLWPDLADLDESSIDAQPLRFRGGVNNWVIQTFLRLRSSLATYGVVASLGQSFRQDCINVAHRDSLARLSADYARYCIVGIRADRPPLRVTRWEIVQNKVAKRARWRRYMPLWPQPGLLRRSPSRGRAIRTIGYFGRTGACPGWFFDPSFHAALDAIGVEFHVHDPAWHDYSDVDVALSCRIESPTMLRQKPASKLVNAWLAGVPLLAKPEPAFEALRRSPLDYLPIAGPQDVIAAIERLRSDPELYEAMVANGSRRGEEFTVAETRERWLDFLVHDVIACATVQRNRLAPKHVVGRLLRQKCESRLFKLRAAVELGVIHAVSRH